MARSREAAAPPEIDGFEPIELIGSGGYADVYLYRQHLPEREVAVKVLVGDEVAGVAFRAEANLMARVSAHPYIVSIFEANVTAAGHPYLVMEYYPRPNYQERARTERLDVPSVLQDGIRLASAVETAHRAGILHRDLKPANVLTSEYGRPGLTDFGIATGAADDGSGGGLSIPWAPPEAFGPANLDERSDVYSLAATVYQMLAGRSPFEQPGGVNTALALMQRVERDRLPRIGRPDVPASLDRVLQRAMSKDPADRPESAAGFARSLQLVESELNLGQTLLEVPNVGRIVARSKEDDDSTRVRSITEIPAQGTVDETNARPAGETFDRGLPTEDDSGATVAEPPRSTDGRPAAPSIPEPESGASGAVIVGVPRGGIDPLDADTRKPRERVGLSPSPAEPAPSRTPIEPAAPSDERQRWPAVVAGVALLGVLIAVAGFGALGGSDESSAPSTTAFAANDVPAAEFLDPVADLTGRLEESGAVIFEWTARPELGGDLLFEFTRTDGAGRTSQGRTAVPSLEFDDIEPGGEVCVDVIVTAPGFTDSAARKECVGT